jgi:hypothetical protein
MTTMWLRRVANMAWKTSFQIPALQFRHALRHPEETQEGILARLLRQNRGCAYGRRWRFETVGGVRDFKQRVPIVEYDDLVKWIEEIKHGRRHVLSVEPVLVMETSSGSSAAAKFIPYTESLRQEFRRALGPWIVDLHRSFPDLSRGRAYWLVTPLAREPQVTAGGLPVGFETDTEYFGTVQRAVLQRTLAVPNATARVRDLDASLYVTLRFLLQARDLTFISVWNPSLLVILLDRLLQWGDRLVFDLRRNQLTPPSPVDSTIMRALHGRLCADTEQADALARMLASGRIETRTLWPRLGVISCWTSAAAAPVAARLRVDFPAVNIQGKGLLATEGVVSIPMEQYGGCAAAVNSHFFEFIENEFAAPMLLHELQVGHEYSVVLTTGGGLWRYRLGDRVRVTRFAERTPMLEFVGKEDSVSDLRGEKLNAAFVGRILAELQETGAYAATFSMLAPAPAGDGAARYLLFLDGTVHTDSLARILDVALRRNPHYAYCRDLGQLAAPAIVPVRDSAWSVYLQRFQSLGIRAGSIKPKALDGWDGWQRIFAEVSP